MKPATVFTRRKMLKTLGMGVALLGLRTGAAGEESGNARKEASAPAPQPFTLPTLPYAYDALEPHIDARTMELHHTKHHQAYIDSANRVLAEFPEEQKKTADELLKTLSAMPERIRFAVRNNVGGHANHSLFWRILSPQGGAAPAGGLASAIDTAFGSFDAFKTRFLEVSLRHFASGWSWLSVRRDGALVLHSTANQDSPLLLNLVPVLGLDLWEHAYYLKHENRRVDYINTFWNVANWRQIEANYAAAKGA